MTLDVYELSNLLLAYFDGQESFWHVEDEEGWNNTQDHVLIVQFSDRKKFQDFEGFVHGVWGGGDEADANLFDLKPFLIDISYSEMTLTFNVQGRP